jgi:hypothetical protein
VNRFVDHSEVVTTNNYNNIADCHTTNHSTPSLLSLRLIININLEVFVVVTVILSLLHTVIHNRMHTVKTVYFH